MIQLKANLTFLIRDFDIRNENEINFHFDEENSEVIFYKDKNYSRFKITYSTDIYNEPISESLYSLSNQELPEKINNNFLKSYIDGGYIQQQENGKYKIICYPVWDILGDETKQFIESIYSKLSELANQIIQVIFWRYQVLGLSNPLSVGPFEISIDNGKKWFEFQMPFHLTFDVGQDIFFDQKKIEEIKSLIKSQKNLFSIGFELWREAWHNRNGNTRSSWLLGISALEASVVIYISKFVPKAEWLITENPKPNLIKIYRDYFPKLIDNKARTNFFKLKGGLAGKLEKAISKRNNIAHTGKKITLDDDLESTLILCRDILYMTDYHFGNDWALDYITKETKKIYGV